MRDGETGGLGDGGTGGRGDGGDGETGRRGGWGGVNNQAKTDDAIAK